MSKARLDSVINLPHPENTARQRWRPWCRAQRAGRPIFGRPIQGPCDLAINAPCGWAAWDQLGRDPAIMPTLQAFRLACALNVTVFFITPRPENPGAASEGTLAAVGYGGYVKLHMVPNGAHFSSLVDFKTPIRAKIKRAGYSIYREHGRPALRHPRGFIRVRTSYSPIPFYRVP